MTTVMRGQTIMSESRRTSVTEATASAEIVMIIDGAEQRFGMPFDADNIIAAAIASDLDPPHACLEGICSSCRARVLEGNVAMEDALGLSRKDREDGYILACQSRPLTAKVILSFDDN